MNREEISKFLGHPYPKLAEAGCKPEMLEALLSLAIQEGIGHGRRLAYEDYNRMLLGSYNKATIAN